MLLTLEVKSSFSGHQLYFKDFSSVPRVAPGQWCLLSYKNKRHFLGIVNPNVNHGPICHLLQKLSPDEVSVLENWSDDDIKTYIRNKITQAKELRESLLSEVNYRAFYGNNDGLPGLIVDNYNNALVIEMNTAGLLNYNESIIKVLRELYPGKAIVVKQSEEIRAREGLYQIEVEDSFDDDISITESGISYKIERSKIQKLGHYFDHRENRNHLFNLLKKTSFRPESAVDLFCYTGMWGSRITKAINIDVDYVDQADMKEPIKKLYEKNNFEGTATFYHQDVFEFLEEKNESGKKYDLVVCDPPAFTKRAAQRDKALVGYNKLYKRVLEVCSEKCLLIVASCTSYVSAEDLDQIIQVNICNKRTAKLIHSGHQSMDHPCVGLKGHSNYIKYLLYWLEPNKMS